MHDYKRHVETNANLILNLIRENDNITINGLQNVLKRDGNPMNLTCSMIRKYIQTLCKNGYLQKKGIHTHTYTAIKSEPFTYVPVAWNRKKQ
jgi:predicted HTH transcriptional regulator